MEAVDSDGSICILTTLVTQCNICLEISKDYSETYSNSESELKSVALKEIINPSLGEL
jgi:hypothetical protein